jgi:xylobiose transport system substrate-binding protein
VSPTPQTSNHLRPAGDRPRRHLPLWRVAAAGLMAAVLAACGTSAPEEQAAGGSSTGTMRVWTIGDALGDTETAAANHFNISSGITARVEGFGNDPYKDLLANAMDTANAPDVFFNWGGGHLKPFVDEGQVLDLTEVYEGDPQWREQFLPTVLESIQVDGRYYGVPARGTQPVILFYNQELFQEAGVSPPATWDELLSLVDTFNSRGITPLALAGSQGWTELMYIEYLLDRIGGPEKFQAIAAGEPGAWRDPAVAESLEMIRELTDRNAFGEGFERIVYDLGAATRMLATGEAAMHVMGSWDFGRQADENPEIINEGNLGWVPFPAVSGGAGDPANLIGNPSNYMSIRADTAHPEEAVAFLKEALVSDTYVNARVGLGEVPAMNGLDQMLAESLNGDYLTFIYELVQAAPAFTLSWDQTLSAEASATLLSSLQQFFLGEIGTEEFIAAMEGTTGGG